MATPQFPAGIDLLKASIINAVAHPVGSDPTTPANGQFWYRTDTNRLMVRQAGVNQTVAILDDVTAGSITGALWNAQSVVVAVTDDTPIAQVIGEGQMLGRATGGDVTALTAAQIRTLINVTSGADVTNTATVTAAGALMDSEVDDDIKTLVLPAATTISAFGASLIDDAASTNARTTLGLVIGTNVQAYSAILNATTASFTTALNTKLTNIETAAEVNDTAAEILAKLITVDGAASGLDADTLDGAQGSAYALRTYVDTEVSGAITALVGGAPGALDTLNELAAAINDDASFTSTVTTALGLRTRKYSASIGNGSATAIAASHGLATTTVIAQCFRTSNDSQVFPDVVITSASAVTFTFGVAPTTDEFYVVIVG